MSELKLPTRAEALSILVAAGCSKNVIKHCNVVSDFSVKIAKAFQMRGIPVNVRFIEIGGLLHDIGRSKTHTADHGLIGGKIARSLKLPHSVVRIIERHVGGGIPREEARRLGWPPKGYLPETWEEKIVCYADKRTQGLRLLPIERALRTYVASLGKNHPAIDRIMKLHKEIVAVVGEL